MISISPTTPHDLPFVVAAEQHPDNRAFVGQWPLEQHQQTLGDPDCYHGIVRHPATQQRLGFLIIAGRQNRHQSIELRRLVITEKGHGYGRAALRWVQQTVFEQWQAYRLWLDVKQHNTRARQLYRAEQFVEEGVVRDCLATPAGRESLVLMAILRPEYLAGQRTLPAAR